LPITALNYIVEVLQQSWTFRYRFGNVVAGDDSVL